MLNFLVYTSRKIKLDYHIEYVTGKIFKSVGVLYRLRQFLPASILKLIYLTFIVPHFTYGIAASIASYKSMQTNCLSYKRKQPVQLITCIFVITQTIISRVLKY